MMTPAEDRALLDRRLRAWLDDGPDLAPHDLADDVMDPIPTMRRRPSWSRYLPMAVPGGTAWLAAAAAVVAVAVALGMLALLRPLPDIGAPRPTGDYMTNDFGVSRAGQVGRAGWYRSWQFRPQVRFEVPAGWGVRGLESWFIGSEESVDALPLSNGGGAIVLTRPRSVDAPGPGPAQDPVPDDVLAWLVADPDLDLGPATAARIGGRDAIEVTGTLAPDAAVDDDTGGVRLTDEILLLPRHQFRLTVVPDEGGTLIFATIAPAERFDEFQPVADGILDSLTFVEP